LSACQSSFRQSDEQQRRAEPDQRKQRNHRNLHARLNAGEQSRQPTRYRLKAAWLATAAMTLKPARLTLNVRITDRPVMICLSLSSAAT